MKVWKVALISTLVAILALGTAIPVLAASDDAPPVEFGPGTGMLKGEVVSIGESSFTIQAADEEDIVIRVNDGTRYFKAAVPEGFAAQYRQRIWPEQPEWNENQEQMGAMGWGVPNLKTLGKASLLRERGKGFARQAMLLTEDESPAPNLPFPDRGQGRVKRLQGNLRWLRPFGEEVAFGDVAVGDRVVVRTVPNEGEPLAKLVLIMAPTAYQRVTGTVTGVNESAMTITLDPTSATEDGVITFTYDDNTTFILHGTPFLKEGLKAVVIYVEEAGGLLAKRVAAGERLPELAE